MEIALWVIAELLGGLFSEGLWSRSPFKTGGGKVIKPPAAAVSPSGPCAYCRKRGGRFVSCRTCRTPHHHDCARMNRRCAVYGCANRTFTVPAA